jgi:hypothetical protein
VEEFTSERGPAPDQVPVRPVGFKLDGVEFTAMTEVTGDALLEWSEFGIAAADDVDVDSPEGVSYLARFLRAAFTPAEYQRFRRHVRSHRTPPETVMRAVGAIQRGMAEAVEELTDRPTVPSSPSSDGDAPPDVPPARVISLDKGLVEYREPTAEELAMGEEAVRATAKPRGKAKAAGGKG